MTFGAASQVTSNDDTQMRGAVVEALHIHRSHRCLCYVWVAGRLHRTCFGDAGVNLSLYSFTNRMPLLVFSFLHVSLIVMITSARKIVLNVIFLAILMLLRR